jgi:hypothetical protein
MEVQTLIERYSRGHLEEEMAARANIRGAAQILIQQHSQGPIGEERTPGQIGREVEGSSRRPVEEQEKDSTQGKTQAQMLVERYSQDPLGEEFRPPVNNARRPSPRLLLMMLGDGEWF